MAKLKGGLGKGLSALIRPESEIPGAAQRTAAARQTAPDGVIAELPIASIAPNPFQPRADFSPQALDELKESIRQKGIIQPVTVRRKESGTYELISGERRIRACTEIGVKTIPAYIIDVRTDQEMLELALIENLQREHLNPIEIAISYQRLAQDVGLSAEEIAEKVSKDRSTVVNFLRLLRLPEEIRDALRKELLTIGHARAIAGIQDEKLQLRIFKRIVSKGLNVRQVEQIVREQGKKTEKKESRTRKPGNPLDDLAQRMQQILATRVHIVAKSADRGEIVIEYYSTDDLGRLFDLFSTIER
ncbi:MAG TPA: ParB/RepB/Spo0J family partition protein [Bacteroidota bacterium]|nr:ParB/RepB/Spo0J family partition protein [Bacteroidota bacterium]